jgi:hypothetical protein
MYAIQGQRRKPGPRARLGHVFLPTAPLSYTRPLRKVPLVVSGDGPIKTATRWKEVDNENAYESPTRLSQNTLVT